MCAVEAESAKDQPQLDNALSLLQMEDPSFFVSMPQDTGQTLMNGMGELHMQILYDRLTTHYRVSTAHSLMNRTSQHISRTNSDTLLLHSELQAACHLGKMHISYRTCMPDGFQAIEKDFEYQLETGTGKSVAISMSIAIEALPRGSGSKYIDAIPRTCALATSAVRDALADGVCVAASASRHCHTRTRCHARLSDPVRI
jgi:translation elongation factor EF-G